MYSNDSVSDRTCYICKQPGHIARACPDRKEDFVQSRRYDNSRNTRFSNGGYPPRNGGGGNGTTCYKCGGEGHFARECPSENVGDGNGGRYGGSNQFYGQRRYGGGNGGGKCYRCGNHGHMARECESTDNVCYNCKEEGHMARDCPKDSEVKCYKCDRIGHMARDCDQEASGEQRSRGAPPMRGGDRFSGPKECYICHSTDHVKANCPDSKCYQCDKPGHLARDCTESRNNGD